MDTENAAFASAHRDRDWQRVGTHAAHAHEAGISPWFSCRLGHCQWGRIMMFAGPGPGAAPAGPALQALGSYVTP